jgi:hypothetical protein
MIYVEGVAARRPLFRSTVAQEETPMPSSLFLGLTTALSVVGLSGVAAARPCLLGPDDLPVTAHAAPAPPAAKAHGPKVHPQAKTPDPCGVEPPVARTMSKGQKPLPRMLGPQHDDH